MLPSTAIQPVEMHVSRLRDYNLQLREAVQQERVRRYGSNPVMRFALKHFQHRMVAQGDKQRRFVAPAPFHPEFTARLYRAITTPNTYEANACARKFAKSTYGTEIAALYAAGEEERENIVIVGAPSEEKEYQTRLRNIINEIDRNASLRRDYPKLRPGKDSKNQWIANTDSEIVLASGIRIAAMPTGGNIRGQAYDGKRPDLIILDDPETPKSARSKAKCKEWRDWVEADLLAAMANGGSVIWNGTYLSYDCLLLWAREEKGWPGIEMPIETVDGEPNWPALFPYEECRRLEELHGPRAWAIEYLLKPQADEDRIFTREMFEARRYDRRGLSRATGRWEIHGRPLTVVQWVDPSSGQYQDRGDFGVILTLGLDLTTEDMYLMHVERARLPYPQQVERCIQQYDQWQPEIQAIEKNQVQVWLAQGLLAQRAMRIEPVASVRGKFERIESSSIHVRNGKVFTDPTDPGQAALIDEAEQYPVGKNDDCLDALSGAIETALTRKGSSMRASEIHVAGISAETRSTLERF